MPLTDTQIRSLKPKDKPYTVSDFQGLFVTVAPSGSRLWHIKYRIDGCEKPLSFGAYDGDEMTAHGFRATFSTLANESRLWNPDAIERALAHVDGNKIRRIYARGEFWEERVRLVDWWAGYLDEVEAGSPS